MSRRVLAIVLILLAVSMCACNGKDGMQPGVLESIIEPIDAQAIVGTWEVAEGDFYVRFSADGTWEDDGGYTGKWSILNSTTVKLSVENFDDRTTEFIAKKDGSTWILTFDGQEELRKVE